VIDWYDVRQGDVLWDVWRPRPRDPLQTARVVVLEIDHERGTARVTWNGCRPETMGRRRITRFRRPPPGRGGL
jgi:hypothetical protein